MRCNTARQCGELHALKRPTPAGWSTASYNCRLQGLLTRNNTITELRGDWDLVKERPRSHHGNAWDGHHVERGKVQVRAFSIVVLKSGNRFHNDLRLWIDRVDSWSISLNDQKDYGTNVNEAHIRPRRPMRVSADRKRDVIARAKDCAELIETGDF